MPVSLQTIHSLYHDYYRKTGVRPSRIYVGFAVESEIKKLAYQSGFITDIGFETRRPEIFGMSIYIVYGDPTHIFAA